MDEMNRRIINDDALMWQGSKTLLQRIEVKLSVAQYCAKRLASSELVPSDQSSRES